MNAFFANSLSREFSADRLGRIKVLIVGNTGCGKTCLAHLLTSGKPVAHITYPTIGCNVTLTIMSYPMDRAKSNPSLAGQEFFLELWDVGAHPRYEAMRGLFYQGVNGVMLVHDLTFSRSLPSLQRWATEVSRLGTFVAPYSEDRAGLNLGGLPVPCLVVGNKLDLVPQYRERYSHTLREQVWTALQKPLCRLKRWLDGTAAPKGRSAGSSSHLCRSGSTGLGGGVPKESLLHGNLQASVTRGDIDMHAVSSFFCTLMERRYSPSSPTLSESPRAASETPSQLAALNLPDHRPRLSAERLPPVMYNAISEESSPYSSVGGGSLVHTPFSSAASFHDSSGNLVSWAQQTQHTQHAQHGPPAPQHYSGVSVALSLQGPGLGGGNISSEMGAASVCKAAGVGSGSDGGAVVGGRAPLFGGGRPAASLFGGGRPAASLFGV